MGWAAGAAGVACGAASSASAEHAKRAHPAKMLEKAAFREREFTAKNIDGKDNDPTPVRLQNGQ
jgi:hypothetical protein